jgi:hypothetical protein
VRKFCKVSGTDSVPEMSEENFSLDAAVCFEKILLNYVTGNAARHNVILLFEYKQRLSVVWQRSIQEVATAKFEVSTAPLFCWFAGLKTSILTEATRLNLLLNKLQLCGWTKRRFILIYIVNLRVCYMFRPVLRLSSLMSIQRHCKGNSNKI